MPPRSREPDCRSHKRIRRCRDHRSALYNVAMSETTCFPTQAMPEFCCKCYAEHWRQLEADDDQNCFPTSRISAVLIVRLEDAAPHPSSSAWARHRQQRDGSENERACIPTIANFLFANMGRASESEMKRCPFTVALHIGAYYCKQWVKELMYYRCGGDAHWHVMEENLLVGLLRDILKFSDDLTSKIYYQRCKFGNRSN